ncbi:MAG TPA: urate oxidase [Actinomycetes bacterium]|nr:urate oxidase [Actinomycetes bacterium]
MGIVLGSSNYGKAGNHLFKVIRGADRDEVRDYRVDVSLTGDYEALHTRGDNTGAMATDTMRNTVYALAKQHSFDSPEEFGLQMVDYLLTQPRVTGAQVRLVEQRWDRITVDGEPHEHAFTKAAGAKHVATVSGHGGERHVSAGIDDLQVLKTTNSGWDHFLEGGYRTLRDTADRILATSVTATWDYHEPKADFTRLWEGVNEQIGTTFTDHYSPSVQNTVFLMGKAVLERFPDIEKIHFSLPNKHHILYDLSPFGLENDREIYWVTVEPYGLIEATIQRG